MKIQQLACFIEVARTNNFTIASKNLFLSQSSVSYNIRELERELGVSLFSRGFNGSSVDITPQGKALFEIADEIIRLHSECEEQFENIRKEEKRSVPIVCSESLLYNVAPHLVKYAATERSLLSPVSLNIFSAYTIKDVERVIKDGSAEFALYPERPGEDLNCTAVMDSRLFAFVPATYPAAREKTIHLSDLISLPLSLPSEEEQGLRQHIDKMIHSEHISIEVFPCTGDILQDRLANVSLGQCYTISTDWHVNDRYIKKIPIDNPYSNMPIYAIWKKNLILPEQTVSLINYCKKIPLL